MRIPWIEEWVSFTCIGINLFRTISLFESQLNRTVDHQKFVVELTLFRTLVFQKLNLIDELPYISHSIITTRVYHDDCRSWVKNLSEKRACHNYSAWKRVTFETHGNIFPLLLMFKNWHSRYRKREIYEFFNQRAFLKFWFIKRMSKSGVDWEISDV